MNRVGWWFVAAGVLITGRAAIELTNPSYWSPVGTTVAFLVTAWAVFLLAQKPPLRRARVVLIIGAAGTAISAVGNLLEDLFDIPFGGDLFIWGGVIGSIGVVLGAVLTLTVNDRLRWSGLFLLAFLSGGVFPYDGGQFVGGVALLVLGGWLLIKDRETTQTRDTSRT